MRLFGKVDGSVDRYDRAGWLSCPFDLAFLVATQGPYYVDASQMYVANAAIGEVFSAGARVGEIHAAEPQVGEVR